MCKSDRKVRVFNSSRDLAAFAVHTVSWRQARSAGWFDDWGRNVPSKRERRERARIEQGRV